MANIWHGADPAGQIDAGAYELGSVIQALEPVTLTGIRVWSPANAAVRPDRKGHVWTLEGVLLATVDMPDTLPEGWSSHSLPSPLPMSAGDFLTISYETSGNYGAISGALTANHVATDGAMMLPDSQAVLVPGSSVRTGNGRYSATPGTEPTTSFGSTFYGVDAEYTPSLTPSGTAPEITSLVVTPSGMSVSASITATDAEGLAGATYGVEWGDGSTDSGPSGTFSHLYASAGVKAVLAYVSDSSGRTGYRAAAVEIEGTVPPEEPSSSGLRRVMEALRNTLSAVDGLSVSLSPTGTIKPPHAIVGVPTILDYRKAVAGARLDLEVSITLLTSSAFDETGALRLADYSTPNSERSIFQAIENDRTLSGTVEQAQIRDFRPLGADEYGSIGYYGGEFTCVVMVRGDRL